MRIGAWVWHPRFGDGGIIEDITPDTILVRWDYRTVTRVLPHLSIHHSHVYPRSVRLL